MNSLLKGSREQVGVRGVGRALRPLGGRLLHGDPCRETGDSPETCHGTEEQRREGPQPLPRLHSAQIDIAAQDLCRRAGRTTHRIEDAHVWSMMELDGKINFAKQAVLR